MKNAAIANIKINPGDWPQGPFPNINDLKNAYTRVQNLEFFLGNFIIFNSGELKRGSEKGLHTIVKTMDATLWNGDYHLHGMGIKGILYLRKKGKKLVTENYPRCFSDNPHYTLSGLYGTLPNQEIGTKIKAIKQELHKRDYHKILTQFNHSISKNNKLRLKLLENLYKREISDQ